MHARASVERRKPRAWSFACLGRFARRTKKKREIAGSLGYGLLLRYINDILQNEGLDFLRFFCLIFFLVEVKGF